MSTAEEKLSRIENSCRNLLTEGASEDEVQKSIKYYTVVLIDELQEQVDSSSNKSEDLQEMKDEIYNLEADIYDQECANDIHIQNVNKLLIYIKNLRQVSNPEFPELENSYEYNIKCLDCEDCED